MQQLPTKLWIEVDRGSSCKFTETFDEGRTWSGQEHRYWVNKESKRGQTCHAGWQ